MAPQLLGSGSSGITASIKAAPLCYRQDRIGIRFLPKEKAPIRVLVLDSLPETRKPPALKEP